MELTNEEKQEKVRDFWPIDDVFFEVLAQNPKVCEEMLRTLLEDESLEVIELYIVYISEFDFLKGDKTIYHVEKVLRETGEVIDDGLHEIFVNTVIDDGTDIAELMACFMKKEVKSPKFPVLSAEVQRLKETEGGVRVVCEVMQRYEKLAVEEAMQKDHVEKIKKLLQKGCSKEFILDLDYTEDEYTEAVRELR